MRLSEICAAIVDCEHKTAPEGDGYALSVGTRAMKDGRLIIEACKPVSEKTYIDWTRRMVPAPGDLVLAREAPVGQVVRVPERPLICLGQRTVLIRPNAAQVDPRFLHYWLLGPDAQRTMAAQAAGATVEHLNVEDIRQLDVSRLPQCRKYQQAAAALLGAIDDLIENNLRRVEVLEEMARAIYREWFVRFRYPGHENLSLSESSMGSIPGDWRIAPLFDVADVGFGFSFKSARFSTSGPFPVIRIRDVPRASTRTYSDEQAGERYRVVDGDVLIGMDGEFYLNQWIGGDAWLNQRVARLRPRNGMSARHLMLAVSGAIGGLNASIVGTTVAHLGKRHLEQVKVVVPSKVVLARATPLFNDLASQVSTLHQSIERLTSVRDLLLPKLVGGEVDVSSLDFGELPEGGAA